MGDADMYLARHQSYAPDSVEPKVTISIMDKDEAKRDAPKTATQLPSLENDRTDSELPTFAL
eukprot:1474578-Amphidinium_carterae.1